MDAELRYVLEDKLEYVLVDKIYEDNHEYLILSEVDNYENICLREQKEDGLYTLTEDKFVEILTKFLEKNKDLFE